MADTVQVPIELLKKMAHAREAMLAFEDELEDFLLSQDGDLLASLAEARNQHLRGEVRPFPDIRSER